MYHGRMTLIYDTDHGTDTGWYLRYTTTDGQQADEIIPTTNDAETDEAEALADARRFLAREGLLG